MSDAMGRAAERATAVRSEVQRFLAELGVVPSPKPKRRWRWVALAALGVLAGVVAAVVHCANLLGED